jgi:predicted ATPase
MGRRNYLIEGISGAGKTAVATELQRRGYHAIPWLSGNSW